MSDAVETNVLCYANKVLNMFGLTNDEIAVYIEGLINRSYRNARNDCVIVDQTVPDDTLVKQCSSRSVHPYNNGYHHYQYYLCFALKGLKIGLHRNAKPY